MCNRLNRKKSRKVSHQAEPKKISARKAQKFQRLPGFFAPIFRGVTKRCQNGLWQIRWTCTFTHGVLSRFSENFSGKWLFFCPRQSVEFRSNFDRRFCWLCRIRTPSTEASALASCATLQTLKPQASPHTSGRNHGVLAMLGREKAKHPLPVQRVVVYLLALSRASVFNVTPIMSLWASRVSRQSGDRKVNAF